MVVTDTCTPRIKCEDAASLIMFVDAFLPMLDTSDEDSRDTALNVFNVREQIHQSLGELAGEIPAGQRPA